MKDLFEKETLFDSIKYFPSRTWSRVIDLVYNVKYFFQSIARGYSDMDVIDFDNQLSHTILPRLLDYRKNHDGYPGIFSEYNKNEWKSKEDYDLAIQEGRVLGGGSDAWDEIVDKMIFSFTHIIQECPINKFEKELAKEYKEKYGDVMAIIETNKHNDDYHAFVKDGVTRHIPDERFGEKDVLVANGWEYKGFKKRAPFYYNYILDAELNEKCQEGLELFGKYFRSIWL